LKILHLIYSSGIYGAEKYLHTLLPELKNYDIDCELLFICQKKSIPSLQEYCNEMNEKGIKTTLLPITSQMSFLLTARIIFRYLKANNIQIVHSHLFSADFIAVLIKKLYFKKLIILSTKHGYEEKYLVQYGLGNKKIRHNFYYYISRTVNKRIDYSFAVSQAISNMFEFLKQGKLKMKYIHHGISPLPLNVKQAYVEGDPKIIIVGRLSEMKGHEYLIKALPAVIQKFPNLKLIVLGEGDLKEKLKNLAKSLNVHKHIEFVGFAAPGAYITQCEVMVLPSLFEPFGLVYIESFASKIPVVAFDTQAANEIIEDNKTGILVHNLSIDALAEKIIYLLEHADERKRIVENAYSKYLEYYNLERMVRETVEWYRSVLNTSEK
jgi:glycosyltransferase involved in cell wall biosynthesis